MGLCYRIRTLIEWQKYNWMTGELTTAYWMTAAHWVTAVKLDDTQASLEDDSLI